MGGYIAVNLFERIRTRGVVGPPPGLEPGTSGSTAPRATELRYGGHLGAGC